MIIYSETKDRFREDVFSNKIESVIHDLFKTKMKRSVGASEVASWKNSMQFMDRVLEDDEIPKNSKVGIEYTLPQSSKRIDFILSGQNAENQDTVVIVELKQWQQMKATTKDAIVETMLGGHQVETEHPSYQAWTYAALLEDYNETVQTEDIRLFPCAYLHNCVSAQVVRSPFYSEHLKKAPAFIREDALALRDFIKQHVKYGDSGDILYRIDKGRIRPSKNLADSLLGMLQGNREFLMIDDQKLVYETALALAAESQTGKKNVLIVEGGPGTGKSVVAINLLVELTRRELVAQYVSKNSAPRAVYETKLTGTFKKTHIGNMFKGSGTFINSDPGVIDVLLVDEAHRLNEKSGLFYKGENQIKEIIDASKLSVFFLDEDQRIAWKDIGEKSAIRRWAASCGAKVHELQLESQFRCNGADNYLAWVDHALQIRDTASTNLEDIDYEFSVCDSASDLRDRIFEKNRSNNKARLVAGYCWPWASKKDPAAKDISFPGTDFAMQWNLKDDGGLWIVMPESVNQVGCIHTCQGLDLDYIGVIIGDDFVVRNRTAMIDASKRASEDTSMHGYKKLLKTEPAEARLKANLIVKNTYRTLMTRGLKGCFVYCTDEETNEYFKSFSKPRASGGPVATAKYTRLPVPLLRPETVVPYSNSVPVFDEPNQVRNPSNCRTATDCDWVQLPEAFTTSEGYFVTRMVGESMNQRVPNGSWCLFRAATSPPQAGKVVLVHDHERVAVGLFEQNAKSSDEIQNISISPDSSIEGYSEVEFTAGSEDELLLVAELIAILG